jgi:hypothetical protein
MINDREVVWKDCKATGYVKFTIQRRGFANSPYLEQVAFDCMDELVEVINKFRVGAFDVLFGDMYEDCEEAHMDGMVFDFVGEDGMKLHTVFDDDYKLFSVKQNTGGMSNE